MYIGILCSLCTTNEPARKILYMFYTYFQQRIVVRHSYTLLSVLLATFVSRENIEIESPTYLLLLVFLLCVCMYYVTRAIDSKRLHIHSCFNAITPRFSVDT